MHNLEASMAIETAVTEVCYSLGLDVDYLVGDVDNTDGSVISVYIMLQFQHYNSLYSFTNMFPSHATVEELINGALNSQWLTHPSGQWSSQHGLKNILMTDRHVWA